MTQIDGIMSQVQWVVEQEFMKIDMVKNHLLVEEMHHLRLLI